jgi:hypothetical protein
MRLRLRSDDGGNLGSHHLELNSTELDHVARLKRPRLTGQDPLAIHEGPARALQIPENQAIFRAGNRRMASGHPPR